jgi:hypothetical protein
MALLHAERGLHLVKCKCCAVLAQVSGAFLCDLALDLALDALVGHPAAGFCTGWYTLLWVFYDSLYAALLSLCYPDARLPQ